MIRINVEKKLKGADGLFTLKVNTSIANGELIAIYGPTGAGKSSILRIIAGLLRPEQGEITVDDSVWLDTKKKIFVSPQHRDIGMVFQDYSLFPNMTVRENLEFALGKGQDRKIVDELIDVSQLGKLQHSKHLLLSGGQKQRVALTRALVRKPRILLLDEPLSALDSKMRLSLQDYILDFHRRFDLTTILITHDLTEVMKMSKRVLVLENGLISEATAHEL